MVAEKVAGCFLGLRPARLGQRSELAGHAAAVSQAANASNAKPSGRFLDGVMIQEAAQGRLAPDLRIERRLCWVIKAQRNDITDSLVRAAGIVEPTNIIPPNTNPERCIIPGIRSLAVRS